MLFDDRTRKEIESFVAGLPDAQSQDISNQEKTPGQPTSGQEENQKREPESDPPVLYSKISMPKVSSSWTPDRFYEFKKLLTSH